MRNLKNKISVEERHNSMKTHVNVKWLPSIQLHIRYVVAQEKTKVHDTHQRKLKMLSKEQSRSLFGLHDTVVDYDIQIPQYVMDTLTLGPKNPVLIKFNPKEALAELDMLPLPLY